MDLKQKLVEIIESSGVSGYEHTVAEKIAQVCPWADEIRHSKLGSLVMLKKGQGGTPRPRIMLAAHMDEIGLIVTKIEKAGFLRFDTIGGFDQRVLLAQEVRIHGQREIWGVIGAKPPHVQDADEQKKSVPINELFIDTGLSEQEVRDLVSVGDLVSMNRPVVHLQDDYIAGKAMDDRASVIAMLECLKELAGRHHQADVYAVATVQEEVGYHGAITSTYDIMPDIGIAIDVGHGDMRDVPESDSIKLGNGPGIALGPHVHPKLFERLKSTAKKWNISYSLEPAAYPGGTDAYAIQVTQAGIPTALLSLPLRYMHTPVETLKYSDVIATGRLLAQFIAEIDHEFVEGLKCF